MQRISPLLVSIIVSFLTIYLPAFSQEPEDIIIERESIILKGKFYKVAGDDNKPEVILLQGSPENTSDVLGLGRALSMSGINAMTFNYSGSHQSTGSFSFPNCQADIGSGQRVLDPSFYTARNAASLAEKDLLIIYGLNDTNITMEEHILPLYNALQDAKAMNVQLSPLEDDHTFILSREKIAQTICDWVKGNMRSENSH